MTELATKSRQDFAWNTTQEGLQIFYPAIYHRKEQQVESERRYRQMLLREMERLDHAVGEHSRSTRYLRLPVDSQTKWDESLIAS